MQENKIGSHGVKWGLIIGVIYCFLVFLRFSTGENSPLMFGLWTFVGYIIVMALLLVSGFNLRKKMGGYLETKEVFKSLFYSVLIFELMFSVSQFIYLKYINPDFYYHMRDATEALLVKSKQPQADIDKILNSIDVDGPKKMNLFDLLKSYLFWVALTGAIAFLFALIIKKKRNTIQQEEANNFLQP
jgi:hypothetical protein